MTRRETNPSAPAGQPAPTGAKSNGATTHCLLWLPRGFDAPLDLVRGLNRRHVRVRQVHDAPSVMAQMAANRLNSTAARVLILVEPHLLRQPQRLIDTLRTYYPKALIWRYDLTAEPALTHWEDGPVEPDQTVPQDPPAETEPVEPAAEASSRLVAAPDQTDEPLLSDEELAMLLGDMTDEEPRVDG